MAVNTTPVTRFLNIVSTPFQDPTPEPEAGSSNAVRNKPHAMFLYALSSHDSVLIFCQISVR